MKFASKVGKGIFPKNDPLYNHILRRRRRLLQRFNARKNLCRTIKLSRAWIPWRSSTPLSERHPGIFLSGCDNRTILAKHVTSFAPVAQHHLFGEKDIPLDIAMERNFPRQYRWISSHGEDSTMSFPVSDESIKFVSTFEYRHYLSKAGEGESHHLVANELRKEYGHKDFPFLRGPIRFRKLRQISESPKRHWIFVPWSFSFAAFDPKTKTNFEGETLYRAPICDSLSFQNTENIRF